MKKLRASVAFGFTLGGGIGMKSAAGQVRVIAVSGGASLTSR